MIAECLRRTRAGALIERNSLVCLRFARNTEYRSSHVAVRSLQTRCIEDATVRHRRAGVVGGSGVGVMRARADLSMLRHTPRDPLEVRTIPQKVKSLTRMGLAMSGGDGVTSTASA